LLSLLTALIEDIGQTKPLIDFCMLVSTQILHLYLCYVPNHCLSKTGIIGLLIRAKQEEHINSLKVELDRLLNQGGFWVEQRLYNQALNAVGEIKL
jgi:uncharacterized protein DUF3368